MKRGILLWCAGFCFAIGATFWCYKMGLLHSRIEHVFDTVAVLAMMAGMAVFLLAMMRAEEG
jgi:hypothetical protein